jgi:hypothetical protein
VRNAAVRSVWSGLAWLFGCERLAALAIDPCLHGRAPPDQLLQAHIGGRTTAYVDASTTSLVISPCQVASRQDEDLLAAGVDGAVDCGWAACLRHGHAGLMQTAGEDSVSAAGLGELTGLLAELT